MATTYLYRQMDLSADSGYTLKFIFSAWVRRGALGAINPLMSLKKDASNTASRLNIYFAASNRLAFELKDSGGTDDSFYDTTRLFTDNSAWYHIYVRYDSTDGTPADRVQLWVNGVRETVFANEDQAGSNFGSLMSSDMQFRIGKQCDNSGTDYFFNGSMSYVVFSNFQSGTPAPVTEFGETDSTTGEWKIKIDPTVTYGTQGVFVLKNGNGVTDLSGEGNNLSTGGTLTNTEDCPDDVFCTFMDHTTSSYTTLSNGGLTTTGNSGSDSGNTLGSLGITTGKYYFELEWDNIASGYGVFGMLDTTYVEFGHQSLNGGEGYVAPNVYGINVSGNMYDGSENSSWTSAFSNGNILGFAFDMTNGAWYMHLNGTYYTSGDPTSGASKTGAISTWTPNGKTLVPWIGSYDGSITKFNFGNGYFGDTIISSEGTNASNIGKFEFDVPAGYTAISTKGLNS